MHLACCRRIHTTTAVRAAQQQRLSRRGQNLTERYRRLERSLRGGDSTLSDLPRPPAGRIGPTSSSNLRNDPSRFFKGFRIPEEPKAPEPDECCMSGCAVCVYDLYQDTLTAYHESLESLRLALSSAHIPESEWPTSVQRRHEAKTLERSQANVSLVAFEELEKRLRAKRSANIRREQRFNDRGTVLTRDRPPELHTSAPGGTNPRTNEAGQVRNEPPLELCSVLEAIRWWLFCKR